MKVQNLWVILGGEHYGRVTLNNLRMVLLAVKGMHVQPDAPLLTMATKNHEIFKIECSLSEPVGIFGATGDIYLFESDVSRII